MGVAAATDQETHVAPHAQALQVLRCQPTRTTMSMRCRFGAAHVGAAGCHVAELPEHDVAAPHGADIGFLWQCIGFLWQASSWLRQPGESLSLGLLTW